MKHQVLGIVSVKELHERVASHFPLERACSGLLSDVTVPELCKKIAADVIACLDSLANSSVI